jgi:DNA-binding MarR family transcriptional regulator
VKTRKEKYTFSVQEIKIAREIASDNHGLAVIREDLSIKQNLMSHYLKLLQDKGLIRTEQTILNEERNTKNSRKSIFFRETKHATLLKQLLTKYSHIKWETILTGLRIDTLFQILTNPSDISQVASPATLWRYTKQFMALGIVTTNDELYQINERFSLLKEFLEEYQNYFTDRLISSVSSKAVILWRKGFEFLIRVPKTVEVFQEGFAKTATSRLPDHGIQLVSDFDVYYYSRTTKGIDLEDVILHTLLVEKGNVRYTTYSLLLLKRELKNIDRDYLLKKAVMYDLSLQINAMLEFLRTKGVRTLSGLPTWNEFMIKVKEYEVEVPA